MQGASATPQQAVAAPIMATQRGPSPDVPVLIAVGQAGLPLGLAFYPQHHVPQIQLLAHAPLDGVARHDSRCGWVAGRNQSPSGQLLFENRALPQQAPGSGDLHWGPFQAQVTTSALKKSHVADEQV
jgi:hypothetical protein